VRQRHVMGGPKGRGGNSLEPKGNKGPKPQCRRTKTKKRSANVGQLFSNKKRGHQGKKTSRRAICTKTAYIKSTVKRKQNGDPSWEPRETEGREGTTNHKGRTPTDILKQSLVTSFQGNGADKKKNGSHIPPSEQRWKVPYLWGMNIVPPKEHGNKTQRGVRVFENVVPS